MGLEPSVYGGGGSPSSADLPGEYSLGSLEKVSLDSAITDDEESEFGGSSSEDGDVNGETKAGSDSGTVTLARLESAPGWYTRDKNGGGCAEIKLNEEACEDGECGGGAV